MLQFKACANYLRGPLLVRLGCEVNHGQVTVLLSDTVLAQAEEAGLLAPEALEQVLKDELCRRAFNRFSEMSRQLQEAAVAEGLEPMTMDEIQEEVNAVRAERRAQAASK